MEPKLQHNLEEKKDLARSAVLSASEAAEQFREDLKEFLSQVYNPENWKMGVKLVLDGGFGLLKDIQEMLTQHNWTPDKLVLNLSKDMELLVKKHPELESQWDNVKVSFHFAKLKTDEALIHIKEIAKQEYGKFDQAKVIEAVWSGVKEELKLDLEKLHTFKGWNSKHVKP